MFGFNKKCLAIVMMFCTSVTFAKESTKGNSVDFYLALRSEALEGNKISRNSLDMLMDAMVDSFIYSDAAMKMDTGKSWLCVPPNMTLSGGWLKGNIDSYIKAHPERVKPSDRVALIALIAVREKYPCK